MKRQKKLFMKVVLCTISLMFLLNVSKAQSEKDTKEFIELKLKSFNTDFSLTPSIKTSKYFEFYKQFLLIKEVYNYKNDYDGYKYTIVDIKKIKSFDFEKYDFEVNGKILSQYNIVIDLGDAFPFCLKKNVDPINLIDSKVDLNQYHFNCSNPIRILYFNPNKENEQKIIKAFNHLVKLYGGKIIDDLF